MNDYKGSAMNDYTMVVVILSAMFLKNEPVLWMIIEAVLYEWLYNGC
jgi:hypothetical protein